MVTVKTSNIKQKKTPKHFISTTANTNAVRGKGGNKKAKRLLPTND